MQEPNLVAGLKLLQATIKKKEKQRVITEHLNDNAFLNAIEFRLNPFIRVGISTKKLNKNVKLKPNVQLNTLDAVINYLTHHPTGTDQDIANVNTYVNQYTGDHQDIIKQLITKTLTLGIGVKSYNELFDEPKIPDFNVQLAFPYAKKIDQYTNNDEFYVTKKLDGHRAITFLGVQNGQLTIQTYTRQGQIIDGLTELTTELEKLIVLNQNLFSQFKSGVVLDGEILLVNDDHLDTGELFRATSKKLRSDGDKTNLQYNIFDMLPLDEFLYADQSEATYQTRRKDWLNHLYPTRLINIIHVLDKIQKDKIPYWSHYATEHGWEGVMLNAIDGHYKKTRSPQLLKVKTMHTADLPIVGFNQADSGRFKGQLQSLNVQLDAENVVQVGSGLSEEQRHDIWQHQDKYLNVMIEVQYFELTENENGGKSLRFPVFKAFRFDKSPDDINIE